MKTIEKGKEMLHIVSFSGGMGSFAEAKACCDLYGKENVKLLFADTNMEDEDLYRFKDEVVGFLGVELISISDGRNPFEVFIDEKFMGNSRIDPCSKILKRNLLNRFIKENFQPDEINVHLGIDYSEQHRIKDVKARMLPYVYRSLLVENGVIVPKNYSEKFGIKRPRLYDWGLGHNNCGGFCPKAGLGHYKKLFEANPVRYDFFAEQEAKVYKAIGKEYPFLKKQIKGKKYYITLKQYKDFLVAGEISQEEEQEYGGCGCAI